MDIISIAIAKKGAKIYTDTIAATKADKANTYTKAEVDKKLADVIQYTVVEELPETGSEGVIYLLPNGGEAPNVYDEYIWNTEPPKWEKIGTTEIDLTPYYQKTEVNELLDGKIDIVENAENKILVGDSTGNAQNSNKSISTANNLENDSSKIPTSAQVFGAISWKSI